MRRLFWPLDNGPGRSSFRDPAQGLAPLQSFRTPAVFLGTMVVQLAPLEFFVLAACRFLEGGASHDPTPGTCALVEIVWVPSSDPSIAFRCREGHILCRVVRLTFGLVSRWHCGGWVVRMSLSLEIGGGAVGGVIVALNASVV